MAQDLIRRLLSTNTRIQLQLNTSGFVVEKLAQFLSEYFGSNLSVSLY